MSESDNTTPQESRHDHADDSGVDGAPHAHCLAAGRIFQAVGLIMLVTSGCVWLASGLILPPVSEPAEQWSDYLSGPWAATALLTIVIVTACVGGLGLYGAGMGLTNERRSAGLIALCVTGLLSLIFLACAAGFAFLADAPFTAFVCGLLGLIAAALCLMAAHCAALLKRHPPPQHHEVTEAFLEQYRRERDQRRKKYDI